MNELSALSSLFSDDQKKCMYFVSKIFPFSLKGEAKSWYDSLTSRSIRSPMDLVNIFFHKYIPASAQHAALQKIFDFVQVKEENLPVSWARFTSLLRTLPGQQLPRNELLDIFYNGLTVEFMTFLDSCAGGVFRNKTLDEAEELIAKISKNHDDWSTPTLIPEPISIPTPEPTPTPAPKKRGMLVLNEEEMKEGKKSLKKKCIKSEDVKNLPPIEYLCKPIPPSPMIEVHSLRSFDEGDIPYLKPPDQCLEELDTFIAKQENFNNKVENHLMENSRAIDKLHDIIERTSNDVKMVVKHFRMVQTQIDQLTKVQKDLLVNAFKEKQACEITTRRCTSTQDPLYPEENSKRIEQDSQKAQKDSTSFKKNKHKTNGESSEHARDPNSVSVSDAETESGNEKENASDKEEVEEEPKELDKNAKYTKEDSIARKRGSEREPWVQKPMPFPHKKLNTKEREHYNKFCEWMKPLFLQIPLTDAIQLPPYSKYLKVTNKRKIPNEEISTMLANY